MIWSAIYSSIFQNHTVCLVCLTQGLDSVSFMSGIHRTLILLLLTSSLLNTARGRKAKTPNWTRKLKRIQVVLTSNTNNLETLICFCKIVFPYSLNIRIFFTVTSSTGIWKDIWKKKKKPQTTIHQHFDYIYYVKVISRMTGFLLISVRKKWNCSIIMISRILED